MIELKTIDIKPEHQPELNELFENNRKNKLLLEQLKEDFAKSHDLLWTRIQELYPEVKGKCARVSSAGDKLYIYPSITKEFMHEALEKLFGDRK